MDVISTRHLSHLRVRLYIVVAAAIGSGFAIQLGIAAPAHSLSHLPTLLIRALSRVLSPTDLRQRPGLPSERRASDAPRIIETFQNDQAQLLTTCSMLGRGESSREACGRGVPGVGGLQQGQGGFDRSSLRPMTLFP